MSVEFACDRLLFAGLPFGDLRRTAAEATAAGRWAVAFEDLACAYESRAIAAERDGHGETARRLWRWSAIAHQGSSFEVHLAPQRHHDYKAMERARRSARAAFHRFLVHERGAAARRTVSIRAAGRELDGYFRSAGLGAPCVVLVNGLDSIAEVEMQAFARWFTARGASVLSLNIPVDYVSADRTPLVDARPFVSPICDWIGEQAASGHIGVFGVSFGGHLVAQCLASDPRVVCGTAVCPPAFIGPADLRLERIRVMWACALRTSYDDAADCAGRLPQVQELAPPHGELLLIGCHRDPVFGEDHLDAYRHWGRQRLSMRMLDAEHVATSRYHDWLPDTSDWMVDRLAAAAMKQVA